ncbi:MAG: hypothetical protein RIR00_1989 [Pseudomonadota bacterium]
MFAAWLQRQWFAPQRRLTPALWLLWPLLTPFHLIFTALSGWRRLAYQRGWQRAERLPVPVVVVGNISVGGTGKTPLTLWLARGLSQAGRRPGIVCRGYGGSAREAQPAKAESLAAEVGDEPLLLALRSGVPVWIGRDRPAAARALLAAHPDVDLILCDDGLQHYRLARDVEIAVMDGRGTGNGWRLPLGPLREPAYRLRHCQALVLNGGGPTPAGLPALPCFSMHLRAAPFQRLDQPGLNCSADALRGRPLFALAGIGDPQRFFRTLAALGLEFTPRPFPDHHAYTAEDLAFAHGGVLLMTEKDGVKCRGLFPGEAWVLPVEAELPAELLTTLLENLRGHTAS